MEKMAIDIYFVYFSRRCISILYHRQCIQAKRTEREEKTPSMRERETERRKKRQTWVEAWETHDWIFSKNTPVFILIPLCLWILSKDWKKSILYSTTPDINKSLAFRWNSTFDCVGQKGHYEDMPRLILFRQSIVFLISTAMYSIRSVRFASSARKQQNWKEKSRPSPGIARNEPFLVFVPGLNCGHLIWRMWTLGWI